MDPQSPSSRAELIRLEDRTHVTYNKAFRLVKSLEPRIRALGVDAIVAVLRSGAIPSMMLSQRIDKPVIFCQCNRGDSAASWLQPTDLTNKRVLIVDDFSCSGMTLEKAKQLVQHSHGTPKTMALFFASDTQMRPDVGYEASNYIEFAWDRLEVTPSSRKLFAEENSRYAPEEVQEFYGVDLDGILTPDLPRAWYDHPGRLQAVLALRDTLPLTASMPTSQVIVITARPTDDYERTRNWLDAKGLAEIPLFCRDPKSFGHSVLESAKFKASIIREQGVSTYYESELQQAAYIAELCPVADVIWWRSEKQVRIAAETVRSVVQPFEQAVITTTTESRRQRK